MNDMQRIREYYYQLKSHDTAAYRRDVREFALENFDYVLSVACEEPKETELHTIADNYGAGDLSRMEPCMFCEDFEKLEEANSAMYEALKEIEAHLFLGDIFESPIALVSIKRATKQALALASSDDDKLEEILEC